MRQLGPNGENINGGNGKKHAPATGNNGGKGISTSASIGHLLLPHPSQDPTRGLTVLESRYVTEFIKDPKASLTDIAIKAGYSEKSASTSGCLVLQRTHVIAEIKDQLSALATKERISIQRMARKLATLADVDKAEAMNEDGTLKNVNEMPPALASLVESYESREIFEWETDDNGNREKVWVGYAKKIKFVDPLKPLEMLSRILKIVNGDSPRPSVNLDQSTHYHDKRVQTSINIKVLNQLSSDDLQDLHRIASRVNSIQDKERMKGEGAQEAEGGGKRR